MTVIAWDGKTLAADKRVSFGGTIATVTKIFKHKGELLGIVGGLSDGMELIDWYKAGAKPEMYPAVNRDKECGASLIVVRGNATVWKYESSPSPFQLEGFCAFGSGHSMALVAMACGCDASGAVEMASRFSTECGNGIDTLELK